jgi:hypothetical protein
MISWQAIKAYRAMDPRSYAGYEDICTDSQMYEGACIAPVGIFGARLHERFLNN